MKHKPLRKAIEMHMRFWRPPLQGRAARHLIASALGLVLGVGVLTASTLFSHPAAAAPRQQQVNLTTGGTPRLEVFTIIQGLVNHRWSDDNGADWSSWVSLAHAPSGNAFTGTPAAVSDGPGRLMVFARDSGGTLWENDFNTTFWAGWTSWGPGVIFAGLFSSTAYTYISDPALTSWGPGRRELFIYGRNQGNGNIELLHAWGDNYAWSNSNWESLGVGQFQGNPAAVSWGPGRDDVFMEGAGNDLEHKWFGNGSWSSGLDFLGGTMTSNPVTTSLGSGRLDVFVRGTDGHVWDKWFSSGGWSSWTDRGCCLTGDVASSVAVASPAPGTLNLFVIGTLHDFYRKPFTDGVGYGDWQFIDHTVDYTTIAAAAWTLPPPPPPPTPTPVPTRPPRCLNPPCTVTP